MRKRVPVRVNKRGYHVSGDPGLFSEIYHIRDTGQHYHDRMDATPGHVLVIRWLALFLIISAPFVLRELVLLATGFDLMILAKWVGILVCLLLIGGSIQGASERRNTDYIPPPE